MTLPSIPDIPMNADAANAIRAQLRQRAPARKLIRERIQVEFQPRLWRRLLFGSEPLRGPLSDVEIRVINVATGELETLYADANSDVERPNPTKSERDGWFSFWTDAYWLFVEFVHPAVSETSVWVSADAPDLEIPQPYPAKGGDNQPG